ncbi:hypothetical protein [Streptomyces sp. NPDC020983]|uniref:hypothetical protein n=1 Tax=Streptomyces sp. NPDC020983 TaxID=3365106 RepID=UPI00378A4629
MTTTIASQNHGRAIHNYDLLDELQDRYGLTRRETHDAIHQFLDDLDGLGDDVEVSRTPIEPGLLKHNPRDLDVYYWVEITDAAADSIREAFAATYAA